LGLAICFALCALAAIATHKPWLGDAHSRTYARVGLLFPELARVVDTAVEVVIVSPGKEVKLHLLDGAWRVKDKLNHPAHLSRLSNLFATLSTLKSSDMVSDNAANHAVYGVDAEHGVRITLRDASGAVLADLMAGNLRGQELIPEEAERAILAFYVRRAGEAEVYLSNNYIAPVTSPSDWIENKFLASVDPASVDWVERISTLPDSSWRLTRTQDTEFIDDVEHSVWSLESGLARAWAAEHLLAVLTDLRASDVIEKLDGAAGPAAKYGLGIETYRAGIGGAVFQLHLGTLARDGHRYIQIDGLPWVYTIAEYESESLRQVDLPFLQLAE